MPKKSVVGDNIFTVASFDVGVRNLAFCVMQYDGKNFPVLDWQNIDLTELAGDSVDDKECCAYLKTKKCKDGNPIKCIKPAKLCVKEICDDGDDDNESEVDKYYCAMHNPDKTKYKIKEKKKVKQLSMKSIFVRMTEVLDSYEKLWNTKVDHVIIERQFNKNRMMIYQSGLVYSYFMLKHLMVDESRISDVSVVHAKHKLTVYNGPKVVVNRKNAKDNRKLLAVEYCKYMLRGDKKRLSELTKYPKKKDDLSDCFLQGAWYLKCGRHPKTGKLKKKIY